MDMESSVKKVVVLIGSLLVAFNLVSCSCSESDKPKHKRPIKKNPSIVENYSSEDDSGYDEESNNNYSSSHKSNDSYKYRGTSNGEIKGTFKNYDGPGMMSFKDARKKYFHRPRPHHKHRH